MKKETFWIGIILPIVFCIIGVIASLFSTEIRQGMTINPRFTSDTFVTFISVFCLLTAFTLFIVVYIKRKIQSENKYQFSELQKVFDKFVAENSHIRKEFRDKDDEMQKKLYEIKNKLTALKTFRDKEMVRVVNHFNVQLEVFENRFKILQEKLKSTIDIDVTAESYQQNPNEKMNHHQNRNTQKEEIISYNNAFNDWDAGNYGMDNLEDFYSKKKE